MSDQNPPHDNNQPGQPPFGNDPQGQPPYGAPQGQPPFGNQSQPPHGAPQGQPPYGNPQGQPAYGQPIYPQQGYGGPQGPGGPGGPGGPWGPGPGGPQGPGGPGGNKRGLLIGGAVLAVLLVIGGIAGAVALTGDDDDSGNASEETSETTEATSEATDETETTDPTEATEPTESADPSGSGESFEAEYNSDVGNVCNGDAMTNAAAYDASKLKIMPFRSRIDDAESWSSDSSGYGQPWKVEYDDFEDVNVVACMTAGEQGQGIACQAEDSKDKKIDYTYVPVDYSLTFVNAQTGEVIGEGDPLPAEEADCPFVAFIDDDGKSYSSPTEEQVSAAINGYEFS